MGSWIKEYKDEWGWINYSKIIKQHFYIYFLDLYRWQMDPRQQTWITMKIINNCTHCPKCGFTARENSTVSAMYYDPLMWRISFFFLYLLVNSIKSNLFSIGMASNIIFLSQLSGLCQLSVLYQNLACKGLDYIYTLME